MKNYLLIFIYSFVFYHQLFADGITETLESGFQNPFNGSSILTWIGDVNDFEITNSTWPVGTINDFLGNHSIRAKSGQELNSIILTEISEVYSANKTIRWEVFISGNAAEITSTRGAALILFVNSENTTLVELGAVNGYRLRLCDPSNNVGYVDGIYFEKADGNEWSIIDSVHTGEAKMNQGWNIAVERDSQGNWSWGYSNGPIGANVILTEKITDNTYFTGNYSGIHWYSNATYAHYFGFDQFKIDPYTPGLWKSDAISSDWDVSFNWDDGVIPSSSSNIQIEFGTNQPVITSNVTCNNLVLESGAYLTINEGYSLNINGDFALLSDSTSTASIIDNGILNVLGSSTIKKYIKSFNHENDNEYHFLSIPIGNHFVENSLKHYYVYPYNESQNMWNSLTLGDQVIKGNGYAIYYSGNVDHCLEFLGVPTTDDQTINVTASNYSGDFSNDNWNLIGNPFPSAIDWDLVNKNHIESAIYVWNAKTCTYSSYVDGVGSNFNDDGIIPAMQGFFVHGTSSGNLIIPQSSRVHSTSHLSLKEKLNHSAIKISITNQKYSDECVIRLKNGATNEWDDHFDALKLLSDDINIPQIFTLANQSIKLSINTLPVQLDRYTIPIVTRVNVNDSCKLSFSGLSSLYTIYNVILHDIINGYSYKLHNDTIVNGVILNNEERQFELELTKKHFDISEADEIIFNVLNNECIEIKNIPFEFLNGKLYIYDINGRIIYSEILSDQSINISMKYKGTFILRLISDNKYFTKKFIIL